MSVSQQSWFNYEYQKHCDQGRFDVFFIPLKTPKDAEKTVPVSLFNFFWFHWFALKRFEPYEDGKGVLGKTRCEYSFEAQVMYNFKTTLPKVGQEVSKSS